MRGRVLSCATAVALAAGALLAATAAAGQSQPVRSYRAPVTASDPTALTVHVSLSKHQVRIGHQLRVTYSWSDGNGDLVDTNHSGTMAVRVVRNVPCTRTGNATHPVSGHGSWWYRPQAAFTGAFTHAVKIRVGFNVRTGGCAPVEDATATEVVTVLPASTG